MSEPFTLGVPVPSILWTSLKIQLDATMRLFVKDIAKTLGRPEGPLLQALLADKISPYVFEESEDKDCDMYCPVICVKPEAPKILQVCQNPVVWSSRSKRCVEHIAYGPVNPPKTLTHLKRLEDPIGGEPYTKGGEALYVSEGDSFVRRLDYTKIGRFANGVLILYDVADE